MTYPQGKLVLGRPFFFDLAADPPDPDWLVDGLIERGTVNLLTGDSGTAKSFLMMHLSVAMMRGEEWLGRRTDARRVMVIDNENHERLVEKRMRSLGMTNDDREQLRYFSRLGVQLGASKWMERTLAEAEDFKPDVLVIDTVSSCTSVVMNDNDSVSNLYATVLRPLAGRERAVVAMHHERKPHEQYGRGDPRYAALGASAWRTQADSMFSVERKGDLARQGGITTYPIELTMPKSRDGAILKQPLTLTSNGTRSWFAT